MLTTHQLIQTSTSYFFPTLLLIICWYSAASAIRSVTDLLFRMRQKRKVSKSIKQVHSQLDQAMNDGQSSHYNPKSSDTRPEGHQLQLHAFHEMINQLNESLLLAKKATRGRIALIAAEGILFTLLAIASFIWALPVIKDIPIKNWWIHIVGVLFFLCFILKIRRVMMLIPLTILAFISWEVFSFISTFEKTLEATSTLARIKVVQFYKPQKPSELPQVKLSLSFRNDNNQILTLPARKKLYFEGRYYRVSSEVLLFGGRNIATIDRVFSDVLASENGTIMVKKEDIPPQYQWQNSKHSNMHMLPRKRLFHWLWQQFFQLRNTTNQAKYIKMVPLASVPCAPIEPGKKFEIRLRHVGGLECYEIKDKKKVPVKPKIEHKKVDTSKPVIERLIKIKTPQE